MDLAEDPGQVVDLGERHRAVDSVDRVGPEERQVRQVGVVQLHPDLGLVGSPAGDGEVVRRRVDADHLRPVRGEVDGVVADAAAEVDDAAALDRAEQAQLGLPGRSAP